MKDLAGVKQLPWPTQSPGLSLIENIWRRIKLCIASRRHRLMPWQMLVAAISEEWNKLPSEMFAKYATMTPFRLHTLRKFHGGPI